MKHPKSFRDFQRAVMRQQHAAGPDANTRSFRANPGDKDFGRRTGQRHDSMMFRDPIPLVAEFVGQAGQLDRIPQRVRGSETVGNR